ncbi:hypothetical protein FRX31_026728 [Thalictrum thalictroides]|uniref:Uncharacterized protein n=1 Tax=Thalictrum thalictroides TaxID=46969 RepID=A0A7J6VG64_THATH|nr:hypothetical protein FRX31_026728 [Thalictrum thalictroides]
MEAKNLETFYTCFIQFIFSSNNSRYMASLPIICAVVGFSASMLLNLPNLKKQSKQQILMEKLRIISEALEHAEQRVIRFQERHDRLLNQISSYYLCSQQLEEALVSARATMNEALEFAITLQQMQMKLIRSYTDEMSIVS